MKIASPVETAETCGEDGGQPRSPRRAHHGKASYRVIDWLQVPGCAFYTPVETKIMQHRPSVRSPGSKTFWDNDDALAGGCGGGSK
jgi:hypothetical protein